MKKTKKAAPTETHDDKGFLELAGEAMTVLGHEIVEGKDKLVDMASQKITAVKKAMHKIGKKKVVKKSVKKSVAKVAKKVAARVPQKSTKKKAPAKKKR